MAEPYDTISAIGNRSPSGPRHWYRFSDVSGGVTDEGYASSSRDLAEHTSSALGSPFNWTYRAEANPRGDGFGMLANGQGGLLSAALGMTQAQAEGLMMIHFRFTSPAGPASSAFMVGTFASFDKFYNRIATDGAGNIYYLIQDAGADDEIWRVNETDYTGNVVDNQNHTIAVAPASNPTGKPRIYIDGLRMSDAELDHITGDDNVDNDLWWIDYGEALAVGYRGGVNKEPVTDTVYYDVLLWDEELTDANVADIHTALAGTPAPTGFSSKTVRRAMLRRLFSAGVS